MMREEREDGKQTCELIKVYGEAANALAALKSGDETRLPIGDFVAEDVLTSPSFAFRLAGFGCTAKTESGVAQK